MVDGGSTAGGGGTAAVVVAKGGGDAMMKFRNAKVRCHLWKVERKCTGKRYRVRWDRIVEDEGNVEYSHLFFFRWGGMYKCESEVVVVVVVGFFER